jgi:hypothetical protein
MNLSYVPAGSIAASFVPPRPSPVPPYAAGTVSADAAAIATSTVAIRAWLVSLTQYLLRKRT